MKLDLMGNNVGDAKVVLLLVLLVCSLCIGRVCAVEVHASIKNMLGNGNMMSIHCQSKDNDLLSSTTGEVKSWHEVVYSWVSKPSKRAEVSSASLPSFVVWLSLSDCNITDDTFPKDLSSMPLLKGLRLSRNPIRNLPSSIKDLRVLMELDLE